MPNPNVLTPIRRLYRRARPRHGVHDPILVYQMGKVGSYSLYLALRELHLNVPVYHVHFLNELDAIEKHIRSFSPPDKPLPALEAAHQVRTIYDRGTYRRWNVITLTRTPVKRNVSAFFQNLPDYVPELRVSNHSANLSILRIQTAFLEKFEHNAPSEWFDRQFGPIFHVDILTEPFDRERGYHVFESALARILVLRREDLDVVIQPAMQEFMGLDNFSLPKANVTAQKQFGALYEMFLGEATLPDAYYDIQHRSRYAEHFYTPAELRRDVVGRAPERYQ